MDTLNVLRVIFRQPSAHYRVGFTQMHLHRTLPLPPPSTMIGFIHRLMGCKGGQTLRGFDIAVCGSYESIFYHFQTFRNQAPGKAINPAYPEASHYGMLPNRVQLLNNVYFRLYLTFDDFDRDSPLFMEKLNYPAAPFTIGRQEDLAIIEDLEIKPLHLVKKAFPQHLHLGHWATEETVEAYTLHGPVYLLGTYYRLVDGIRDFARRRFYYLEPQPLNPVKEGNTYKDPVGWIDTDKLDGQPVDIPVFFLDIDKTEHTA